MTILPTIPRKLTGEKGLDPLKRMMRQRRQYNAEIDAIAERFYQAASDLVRAISLIGGTYEDSYNEEDEYLGPGPAEQCRSRLAGDLQRFCRQHGHDPDRVFATLIDDWLGAWEGYEDCADDDYLKSISD